MTKFGFALLGALLAASTVSQAATAVVTDKKSCARAVTDAREALAEASLIERSQKEVEQLIQISAHLCTQASFVFADHLLAIARGMSAEE